MPSKPIIDKPDYCISIRYRQRDGQWSDWKHRGCGKFESIEVVQKQIRLLANAYARRERQVRFEHNGKLCDFLGNETGKVIELP